MINHLVILRLGAAGIAESSLDVFDLRSNLDRGFETPLRGSSTDGVIR
jgi:hypothetical protein